MGPKPAHSQDFRRQKERPKMTEFGADPWSLGWKISRYLNQCGWVDLGSSTVMPMWFLGLCLCGFLGLMKKTHVF
jgi:hypothetical protein